MKLKKFKKVITSRSPEDIMREYVGVCEEYKTLHGAHIAIDILNYSPIVPHASITKIDTVQDNEVYEHVEHTEYEDYNGDEDEQECDE